MLANDGRRRQQRAIYDLHVHTGTNFYGRLPDTGSDIELLAGNGVGAICATSGSAVLRGGTDITTD